ncbi:zinc finger protein ZAT11-like [Curcuma longa]|uniref:zinc finger protein ZAT11-like n=1 Tax=Curcuma longa TaxID=136217 RepID=UPI003D9E3205
MKRYRFGVGDHVESIDMAKLLMVLSRGGAAGAIAVDVGDFIAHYSTATSPSSGAARVFECKTCSRRFPSFQALGGHRASHKKPRLAAGGGSAAHCHESGGRPRVHECAVCGHEFAVGQALGGHMRRHRVAGTGAGLVVQKKAGEEHRRREMMLDLNLPPLENDLKLGMDKILLM